MTSNEFVDEAATDVVCELFYHSILIFVELVFLSVIYNRIEYYSQFTSALFFVIAFPILSALIIYIILLYKNGKVNLGFLVISSIIFTGIVWELFSTARNEIMNADGMEFFFASYFSLLIFLVVIWISISLFKKILYNFAMRVVRND